MPVYSEVKAVIFKVGDNSGCILTAFLATKVLVESCWLSAKEVCSLLAIVCTKMLDQTWGHVFMIRARSQCWEEI